VGLTSEGYEIWKFEFGTEGYPGSVIFNDGGDASSQDKQQTGDLTFHNGGVYDYIGLVEGAYTLNNIIRNVPTGILLTISDELVGVYMQEETITYEVPVTAADGTETVEKREVKDVSVIYCKDNGNYGEPSVNNGAVDYMVEVFNNSSVSSEVPKKTEYDQSNWVKIVPSYTIATSDGAGYLNNVFTNNNSDGNPVKFAAGTLEGTLVDSINPEFHVVTTTLAHSGTTEYKPNVYIMPHFNDTIVYAYTHNEWAPAPYVGTLSPYGDTVKYFFVAPKPMEYAEIYWAVYTSKGDFATPAYTLLANNTKLNEGALYGRATYQPDFLQEDNPVVGNVYSFYSIIRYNETTTSMSGSKAPRRVDAVGGDDSGKMTLYPIGTLTPMNTDPETGIEDLTTDAQRTIQQVRYINVAGQTSTTPWEGVNIVVTRYNDGTQQTTKVIR